MADDGQVSGSGRNIARPLGGRTGYALLLSGRDCFVYGWRLRRRLSSRAYGGCRPNGYGYGVVGVPGIVRRPMRAIHRRRHPALAAHIVDPGPSMKASP